MTHFDRIEARAGVCGGKPVIRGKRFPVHQIVDLVAAGNTPAQIIEDFPYLDEEDIRQALQYAAALARNEISSLP
jgi:uncharacterized protein (DUF433 family)